MPYQLTYTVSEWTQSETLNLNDGETQTFQVTLDNRHTAVLSAVLTIAYTDTGETVTAACDDIGQVRTTAGWPACSRKATTLSGRRTHAAASPRSAASPRTLRCPNTPRAPATIRSTAPKTNCLGANHARKITGDGGQPQHGRLLNANNGNFPAATARMVEVTLTLLIFQPSGMTPTG